MKNRRLQKICILINVLVFLISLVARKFSFIKKIRMPCYEMFEFNENG